MRERVDPMALFLILVILGVLLLAGKGSFLITGYHEKREDGRDKFDKKALCRFMGLISFGMAVGTLPWIIGNRYGIPWLFYPSVAVMAGLVVFMVAYLLSGQRFLNQEEMRDKPGE